MVFPSSPRLPCPRCVVSHLTRCSIAGLPPHGSDPHASNLPKNWPPDVHYSSVYVWDVPDINRLRREVSLHARLPGVEVSNVHCCSRWPPSHRARLRDLTP